MKEQITDEQLKKEKFEFQKLKVDPGQSPIRLDKFLFDKLFQVSRNKIQTAIKKGMITLDGKEVKPNVKIKPNQEIIVYLDEPREGNPEVIPQDIPLTVVYEDEDVMVINKPAGLTVHPGVGQRDGTLVNALMYYFKQKELPIKEGNEPDRPGLVHRIDKDTTGLMVIAKTSEAMTHLSKQFADHTVERKYVALAWGNFDDPDGTITGNLGRHPTNRTKQTVYADDEGGKHAVTHYKVLLDMYYVSLIECQLETGRTHQIRVHMQHTGHPLFNDAKYGGNKVIKGTVFDKYRQFVENCFKMIPRHVLHAKSIGFVHPRTGKQMFFESELPTDFQAVLDKWERYLKGRKKG